MKQVNWTVPLLVAVSSALATLLVVEMTGRREAYAQETAVSGYTAAMVGETYRNSRIPIIIVDAQKQCIMTYEYNVAGSGSSQYLKLTNVRTFKYDRRMLDYNIGRYRDPHRFADHDRTTGNSVEEMREASMRQKLLD
jgi:hypothetical protein